MTTMTTTMTTYGICYGGEGRDRYEIDSGYGSIAEAREAYDASRRITYRDGLLGGASLVELDRDGAPCRTIEVLAEDE